jgi:hypothetical protein
MYFKETRTFITYITVGTFFANSMVAAVAIPISYHPMMIV